MDAGEVSRVAESSEVVGNWVNNTVLPVRYGGKQRKDAVLSGYPFPTRLTQTMLSTYLEGFYIHWSW